MGLPRFRKLAHVKFLHFLSKVTRPFSIKTSQRFARSALKRDPDHVEFDPANYASMIAAWESRRKADARKYGKLARFLENGPVISVLVPVFNTDPRLLKDMIASVRAQRYQNWELCIADDASTAPAVRTVLKSAARGDPRIKVAYRHITGHISQATNSALELATGQFAAFLDHDDLLDRDALLHVAFEISRNRHVKIIYSDEDKISVGGERFAPHFKPAWNRELLYGMNYACHLLVCDTELVRSAGGLRAGFEGAQDHDLLLRCAAKVDDSQICHIPKVLYHWRASPGSAAANSDNKAYATQSGLHAVAEHLREIHGRDIPVVKGKYPFTYVPQWPLDNPPKVSIIIPTRDRLDLLKVSVGSVLLKTAYPDFEIIIIDNGSVETSTRNWLVAICAKDSRVRVIRDDGPFNYSALNNRAVDACDGEVLAFLNNDIEVITPDWLAEMTALALRPDIGCTGAKLLYPDGTIQHAGVGVGLFGGAAHPFRLHPGSDPGHGLRLTARQEYLAVTGACLVMRRAVFLKAGGFNETDLAVAFNDIDLCLKVHAAGYRNIWTPHAELIHYESASRGPDNIPGKRERSMRELTYLIRTWNIDRLQDPAYNPNLTNTSEDFSFGPPVWPFPAAMPLRSGRSVGYGKP